MSYAGFVARAMVRRDLERVDRAPPSEARKLVEEIRSSLPTLETSLERMQESLAGSDPIDAPRPRALQRMAIDASARPYRRVNVPILILAAIPQKCAPDCDAPAMKSYEPGLAQQADAVAALQPGAHIVRLEYADHYVWRSNADQVEREMNSFMDSLK